MKKTLTFNFKKTLIFLLSLVLISLVFSVVIFLCGKKGKRRTFVFPSVERNRFIVETRNLSTENGQGMNDIEYYVREMLLGPQTERTRRLFPSDTKLLSCYKSGDTLYVDFSGDIINPEVSSKMLPLRQAINLFSDNVKRNFPSIKHVEVYVNGNKAYDGY